MLKCCRLYLNECKGDIVIYKGGSYCEYHYKRIIIEIHEDIAGVVESKQLRYAKEEIK